MQETLTELLTRYAQETGMSVRRVPWEQAQKDKEVSRRRDQEGYCRGSRHAPRGDCTQ
jgi:hypothetical protein